MKFSIEQARVFRGYSQSDMAALLGIHENNYRKKEHNPYLFRMGEVSKFLEAVGMQITDLIYFASETH